MWSGSELGSCGSRAKLTRNAQTTVWVPAGPKSLGLIGNAPAHEFWAWRNAVRRSIFDKPTWTEPGRDLWGLNELSAQPIGGPNRR